WYAGHEAAENTYRALLSVGEPVDVLYESDILDNKLDGYAAVVVPQMYVGRDDVVDRLRRYADAGGAVITHADAVLIGGKRIKTLQHNLAPSYQDYRIRNGDDSLRPDAYADWLADLAGEIRAALPIQPRVRTSSPLVIANLMT